MGIASGRFVIDTHVHSLRLALKLKESGSTAGFVELGKGMFRPCFTGTYLP